MKRLIIAAVGLALVVGIVVGGVVGNLFGATAQRTSAAAVTGSGCYTNWNSADCAPGFTAVSTGTWTVLSFSAPFSAAGPICAGPKALDYLIGIGPQLISTSASLVNQNAHTVYDEPCAICCATGSPSAVGGIAELPALAGPAGGSGMGRATYAVLAGAAAGVLAFAVLATLSVKRRTR